MTTVIKFACQHSYRLSAFERRDNDFYPTPSDLVVGLPLGLAKLGLELPRIAFDPCGGHGALRRILAPFGADVSLTDLYPDKYPSADPPVGSKFFYAEALGRDAPFGGTAQGPRSLITAEEKDAGYRA